MIPKSQCKLEEMSGVRACPSKRRRWEWLGVVSILTEARKCPEVFSWVFHTPPWDSCSSPWWSCSPGTLLSGHTYAVSFLTSQTFSGQFSTIASAFHSSIHSAHGLLLCQCLPFASLDPLFTLSHLYPRRLTFINLPAEFSQEQAPEGFWRQEEKEIWVSPPAPNSSCRQSCSGPAVISPSTEGFPSQICKSCYDDHSNLLLLQT